MVVHAHPPLTSSRLVLCFNIPQLYPSGAAGFSMSACRRRSALCLVWVDVHTTGVSLSHVANMQPHTASKPSGSLRICESRACWQTRSLSVPQTGRQTGLQPDQGPRLHRQAARPEASPSHRQADRCSQPKIAVDNANSSMLQWELGELSWLRLACVLC